MNSTINFELSNVLINNSRIDEGSFIYLINLFSLSFENIDFYAVKFSNINFLYCTNYSDSVEVN